MGATAFLYLLARWSKLLPNEKGSAVSIQPSMLLNQFKKEKKKEKQVLNLVHELHKVARTKVDCQRQFFSPFFLV